MRGCNHGHRIWSTILAFAGGTGLQFKWLFFGAKQALGISGALTVVLMSATNFALHSDFRWLLVLPALVWLAGLGVFLANRGEGSAGHGRGGGGVT